MLAYRSTSRVTQSRPEAGAPPNLQSGTVSECARRMTRLSPLTSRHLLLYLNYSRWIRPGGAYRQMVFDIIRQKGGTHGLCLEMAQSPPFKNR